MISKLPHRCTCLIQNPHPYKCLGSGRISARAALVNSPTIALKTLLLHLIIETKSSCCDVGMVLLHLTLATTRYTAGSFNRDDYQTRLGDLKKNGDKQISTVSTGAFSSASRLRPVFRPCFPATSLNISAHACTRRNFLGELADGLSKMYPEVPWYTVTDVLDMSHSFCGPS